MGNYSIVSIGERDMLRYMGYFFFQRGACE